MSPVLHLCRLCWAATLLAVAGCASRGSLETVESQLRQQESMIGDLETELESVRGELNIARADSDALRKQLQDAGKQSLVVEQAQALYRAEGLRFNNLLTTGVDADGQPGDEALSVLLYPVDADGELIKLAGRVELQVLDLSLPHDRQRIGEWSFSADEVRERWHRGFLTAGYLFEVPFPQPPQNSELTLHARLITSDDRRFQATTQLKITPVPAEPGRIAATQQQTANRPVVPASAAAPAQAAPARAMPAGAVPEPAVPDAWIPTSGEAPASDPAAPPGAAAVRSSAAGGNVVVTPGSSPPVRQRPLPAGALETSDRFRTGEIPQRN